MMDQAGLKVLVDLIEANRRMTQDELVAAFAERTGKAISKPTLGRAMKALGYRKVRLQKAPSEPAPQSPPRYGPQHRRQGTATEYPSSLTDREWEVLAPLLANRTRRGRPPKNDKRVLVNAVFYQVRTGTQWRYLPKDLPPWPAVWSFFRRLRDSGKLEQFYTALHELWRKGAGRTEAPTAGIVDSQTAKSTEKGGPAATTPARRSRGASGTWSWTRKGSPAQS
jgi:transposase